MIVMLSNSLIQQHNVQFDMLACQITMSIVSEESSCSMVWWGASTACAEVSTGSVEAPEVKSYYYTNFLGLCASVGSY
jgi:hypothetical protein